MSVSAPNISQPAKTRCNEDEETDPIKRLLAKLRRGEPLSEAELKLLAANGYGDEVNEYRKEHGIKGQSNAV